MKKIILVLVILFGISCHALAGNPFTQEIISATAETYGNTLIEVPDGKIFILTDIIATTREDTGKFMPWIGAFVDGEFTNDILLHINLSIEGPSKSWHFQSGVPYLGRVIAFADQDYRMGFITVSGYLIDAQ